MNDTLDTKALNAAREAGFHPLVETTGDITHYLYRFRCPDVPLCKRSTTVLAAGIEAARRSDEAVTVWLDVQNRQKIPEYVYETIGALAGFGANIVVTQGQRCSHGPGVLLDSRIQELTYEANGSGHIWHPFAQKPVFTYQRPREAEEE